ncbi:MAG TPA: flippase [Candidatus Nanoarchaeia archaeon]|uniref:Polysaccharide biosynthesis protein n=1 Tax=uncultured archaeon Rifle_16ft_4_minimus_37913 TaxID=1665152 RepID=A0A0H4TA10_9ARCH|nr:polysaccharide biosynthesis protein [uncultured archaeon Rifle_16ft_4_minimus_37913]HKZ33964.1 flippase [Candidatus Nanoarchaeia archaeon]
MKDQFSQGGRDIKDIWRRIKNRDFSGNTGLVVKNSLYQFSTGLVAKIGALIFTVVIARLLLPELFGLYSLALSTILLFVSISDLGINQSIIRFISKSSSDKRKEKAAAYAYYLSKIKIIFTFLVAFALTILAKFISQNYYQKPIFYALIAGALYVILAGISSIFQSFFHAINNFKVPFFKEIFLQVSRLFLIPLFILISLANFSYEVVSLIMILSLSALFLLTIVFLFFFVRRLDFLNQTPKRLSKKEKKRVNKFTFEMLLLGVAGLIIGYIDIIFLGRFVDPEYIGIYQAALNFAISSIPLINFSTVLFPLFSKISGDRLEKGFNRSSKITLLVSAFVFTATFLLSPLIIKIVYGSAYIEAITLLRILALLSVFLPMSSLFSSYIIAKGYPKLVTNSLIITAGIYFIISYFLITYLLKFGQRYAIIGACIALVMSNFFYMIVLLFKARSLKKA